MNELSRQQQNDLRVLITFVKTYCAARHAGQQPVLPPPELARSFRKGIPLCADCAELLEYALAKRRLCPLQPKPSCKHCQIHCYSTEYRATIREIMAFSGRRLIMRGRLDYLWHYFF